MTKKQRIEALKTDIVSMCEMKYQEEVREKLDTLEQEIVSVSEVRLIRNNFSDIERNYDEEE